MVFVLVGRVFARIGCDCLVWHWRHWLTEPEPEKLNRRTKVSCRRGKTWPSDIVYCAECLKTPTKLPGFKNGAERDAILWRPANAIASRTGLCEVLTFSFWLSNALPLKSLK